jgi:hypothetical protein
MISVRKFVGPQPFVAELAKSLRFDDRQELTAQHGLFMNIEALLLDSIRRSVDVRVGLLDSKPVCIFGVCTVRGINGSAVGSPWFLATDAYEHAPPRRVFRESLAYMSFLRGQFAKLENYVYYKNERSIKWLRKIGFTVHAERPTAYGIYGEPFLFFEATGIYHV